MILVEVFKHRRKLEPIIQQTWKRIGTEIPYPPIAEDDPEQKLTYFGMVAYAVVYQSALAAGMSTSAAHYLARMQIGKYKLGKPITKVVESIYTGHETAEDKACADFYLTRMAQIIDMVKTGDGEIDAVLQELAKAYQSTAQGKGSR